MTDKLIDAIKEVMEIPDKDKVKLKNKLYTQVAQRVQSFRLNLGGEGRIKTEVIENNDQKVVVQATISVLHKDAGWVEIANDFAEEYRAQGPVNKTSALENCCTSAIGRALSACGLSGGEYASSFEVDNAINSKPPAPEPKPEPKAKKPAKKPQPKTLEEVQDDLELVSKGMIDLMPMQDSYEGLVSFWQDNKEKLDRMQEERDDLYQETLEQFKARASEIKGEVANG